VAFESWRPCTNPACPSNGAAPGEPTFAGIAHVRVNAQDLARSIAWYRDVLGFGEPWFAVPGEKVSMFHAPSRVELVLQQAEPSAPEGNPAIDHFAFRVESVEQLHAWERRLADLGFDWRISQAVGGLSINIEDPDGNDLELFAYDPPRG
jgi:catechol 2,3-dioxygenase-like lactoylglutathione lyase family enzyme